MIPFAWLTQAAERIGPYILETPLTYDSKNRIYLKWENHQVTGSFKARGAINKVLSLQAWERERGLVAASAGNHGQGVALAGTLVGAAVVVFASEHAVPSKVEAMRRLGAQVRLVKGGYGEAERIGLDYAQETGACWISPYNDVQVIAGQATLGLELQRQIANLPEMTLVVPVGGGGLISGIGAASQETSPLGGLVGVQSEASPFFHALFYSGSQSGVEELPSLADGLAGPVEENSLTIPLVHRFVDEMLLVSEEEIAQAISYAWQEYNERIEGSAATCLAAILTGKITHRPAVLIISGGNIQPEVHQHILQRAGQ